MAQRRYHVLIVWDAEEQVWVTEVPALDHISTFGETRDEALRNTVELIEGYLEAAAKEGIEVPSEGAAPQLVELEVGAA